MANDLKMEVILQAIDRATRPIRAITQGSVGLGRALKDSRDQLKTLQAQQSDISSFRALKSQTEQTGQALQASRDTVRQLSREMQEHQRTIAPLQASYDAVAAQSDKLSAEHKALTQQLRETRQESRAANQTWQQNRLRIRELGQQLGSTATPTKKLRDEYAALVAKQKDQLVLVRALTDRQKTLNQQHRESAANTRQHKERVGELSAQLREAQEPLLGLNRAFREGVREATALKRQHQEQQVQLQGLRNKLGAAGISTRNLSQHERDLRQRIEQTNQTITEQGRRMQRLAAQTKQLARAREQYDKSQQLAGSMAAGGAAGLASGYALSRPLRSVVDAFAPAEDAATQLKVAMMDKNGQVAADYQRITDLANGLGDRLPGTTADFQNMMSMLRKQGISAQSILGGTGEAAAYLGVLLKMPMDASAEFAAKMQDATRTSEKDMMGLMDTIQRAFYLGVDDSNMLQGFSKLSPAMGIVKKEGLEAVNTFAPLLVMMDQASMAGESAGNALRKVFQASLNAKKLGKANDLLKEVGLNLDFSDGKGEFGGMEQLYAQLDKLKTLNSMQRGSVMQALFSDDAETLQVVNTMMDKGITGYREVADKLKAQADLRTRVNEQLGTLTNTIEAAQGSWSNALAEMGAAIAPELKEFITDLGSVANHVKEWVKANPALTATVLKVVSGLALLLAIGGGITVMLASFLGPFAMARYAVMLFSATLMGTPIGWFIGAIALLAGAAALIYANWDTVSAFFGGLWAEIKEGFAGGLSGIATLILNFSPQGLFYRAFAALMTYFGVELPAKFSDFGGMLLDGLVNGIKNKLGAVKAAISGVGDSTVGWFKEKLGIHSPSRVFAELGGFTMQGLEQGLVGGQGGPLGAVTAMAKQLAAAGAVSFGMSGPAMAMDNRPPLSAAASSAPMVVQGDTYQITIHAAPGTDTAGLRQMFNQLLDERERGKAARVRSALGDQE
ncbi:phage tail tape measure protein [Stutzerimonas balearica]|uniref:phage tail tape measure protein n=1 Tax=Stutzerimonas balearica TaxID=74829 RepID=UPI001BC973FA|nr:phage tail tape measure protein [Stutzerimonas balearica]MBS4151969.1 phage tail tape measure protein [Stutzerimonas balearica]